MHNNPIPIIPKRIHDVYSGRYKHTPDDNKKMDGNIMSLLFNIVAIIELKDDDDFDDNDGMLT